MHSWSAVYLAMIVVTPPSFGFAVGLAYQIKTGDVSTAWTRPSYILTAEGGKFSFLISQHLSSKDSSINFFTAMMALLAILGTLKNFNIKKI
jgi:hypothetical protein